MTTARIVASSAQQPRPGFVHMTTSRAVIIVAACPEETEGASRRWFLSAYATLRPNVLDIDPAFATSSMQPTKGDDLPVTGAGPGGSLVFDPTSRKMAIGIAIVPFLVTKWTFVIRPDDATGPDGVLDVWALDPDAQADYQLSGLVMGLFSLPFKAR
jgi:hypothetical protein